MIPQLPWDPSRAVERRCRESSSARVWPPWAVRPIYAARRPMRLALIVRHAQSTLNEQHRVNGDPSVPVPLTERGVDEAIKLGEQLANLPIDLCLHTRFGRTRDTAELALANRAVPFETEPLLDDIDLGQLEGWTLDEYRAWKRERTRKDAFPGGESLDDAALRYARAFRRLAARDEQTVFVVTH